jgi:hypothetical protein
MSIIDEISYEWMDLMHGGSHHPIADDRCANQELALAASALAMPPDIASEYDVTLYPWGEIPALDRRTALIRAAALLILEIDRLDRALPAEIKRALSDAGKPT